MLCPQQKAESNIADFVALMPNTEHTLELTIAQTIKTKRDGNFHWCLHLVVQEDDCTLLAIWK